MKKTIGLLLLLALLLVPGHSYGQAILGAPNGAQTVTGLDDDVAVATTGSKYLKLGVLQQYMVGKNVIPIGRYSGDLDAAVAALDVADNTGESFTIVIDQATTMSGDVDLSSLSNAASITLAFLSPAGVITTGGNALTLAQQIPLSVDWQIFNSSTNTDVVFSTGATVRSEWWYDGGGNYLDAFNYAWKSISTSGGALYAPGSYAVDLSSGQITPQSNTTLYGDGDSSVITYTYTGSYARLDACGMQFNDQSNVTIRDIKFAGGGEDYTGTINVDNYPPSAIAVAPSSDGAVADITIDNVTFYGFTQSGIIPSGYSQDPARYPRYRTKRFHVRNSHFIDIGQHAVAMENFTDSSVVGCDFNNVGQTTIVAGGGSGLAVDVSAGCDHIIVKNNIVDDCGGGFKSTSHSLPEIKFFKTTDNGATYTDYSTQVLGVGTADISSLDTLANGDWIVVGAPAPFQSIYFDITAANSNTTVLTAQYWNGSAWTSVNNLEDNTAIYRRKAFAKDGTLFFDKPSDWAKNTVNSVEYYWIRLSVSDALSASVTIDTMYIPELNNDVKFISNTVRNFKEKDGFYGIALNGINILADGNTIDTPYGAGFVTWHLYGECKGISITNNKVLGSQRTLSYGVDIEGYDISCINNLISNSGNYGINISGIVRGTISTNTVINSDESGIRIVGASRDLLVENNKVIDNGSYGINIGSVTNLQLLDNQAFNSNTDNQNYGFIFIGTVIGTFKGNKAFSNISNNWLVSGGDLSGVDGDRVTIKLPDLAAGTSKEVPVMLVEGNGAYVVSSYLIPAVAIAQNDTDYCTFDIQDKGTGGTGTTSLCSAPQTTKSTGGVDFQDFVDTSLAINQNQTIVGGKVLSFKKTDSGSGQELDEAILVINYIAY